MALASAMVKAFLLVGLVIGVIALKAQMDDGNHQTKREAERSEQLSKQWLEQEQRKLDEMKKGKK